MSLTIAIVDDDPVTLFLHEVLIKKAFGIRPLRFSNGKNILDFLDNRRDQKPCFLFLDIHMVGLSGWEVMDAIRRASYNFEIYSLMVSSSIDTVDREKASQYPEVIGYLEKPIDSITFNAFRDVEPFKNSF